MTSSPGFWRRRSATRGMSTSPRQVPKQPAAVSSSQQQPTAASISHQQPAADSSRQEYDLSIIDIFLMSISPRRPFHGALVLRVPGTGGGRGVQPEQGLGHGGREDGGPYLIIMINKCQHWCKEGYMHTCKHVYIYTLMDIYIYAYIYASIYMYIHTYMHSYIHTFRPSITPTLSCTGTGRGLPWPGRMSACSTTAISLDQPSSHPALLASSYSFLEP